MTSTKRPIDQYDSREEWARDFPEENAALEQQVKLAIPYELDRPELEKLANDAWSAAVLQHMESEGVVYRAEDGSYHLTGKGKAE